MTKIKEYEEKKKFHVGDVIKTQFKTTGLNDIGVIIKIDDDGCLRILDLDYEIIEFVPYEDTLYIKNTGWHFSQIGEVLKILKYNKGEYK
jgi:hypothetical protein